MCIYTSETPFLSTQKLCFYVLNIYSGILKNVFYNYAKVKVPKELGI